VTFDLSGDRDAWRTLNASFSAPAPPPVRPPWWRRHLRWIALGLLADVLVGTLLWRWLRDEGSTPERAVQQVAALADAHDWSGLRNALCAPDRARYSTEDLTRAGEAALLALRGVDAFEVDRVVTVPDAQLGPVGLPTRRVEGRVVATLGPPSAAHLTVVKEPTAWKVCLSAGGYRLEALGVDVPPEPDLLAR
jgi:hypothetical protein